MNYLAIFLTSSLMITTSCYKTPITVTTPARAKKTASTGDKEMLTGGKINFNMIYVAGKTVFPLSSDSSNDVVATKVDKAYWVAETEVTYELWYEVKIWADKHGYTFANTGGEGTADKANSENGGVPTTSKNEPVTNINWRDAMVWANALTEWYNAMNKTNYTCAYYIDPKYKTQIRTSTNSETITTSTAGSQDSPYLKEDATGFRLLTRNEWILAAKYMDGKTWAPDKSVSGVGVNMSSTHAVKGLGLVSANALGLYDMLGNVSEWVFDSPNDEDSEFAITSTYRIGYAGVRATIFREPYFATKWLGLRIAKSAE